MMKFKSLTLATRLILFSIASALAVAIIGALALHQMNTANQAMASINNNRVVALKQLKIITDNYFINIVDPQNKLDAGLMDAETAIATIEGTEKVIAEQWKAYKATYLVDAEKEGIAKLEPMIINANAVGKKLVAIIKSGNKKALTAIVPELYANFDPLGAELDKLVNIQLDVAQQEYEISNANYNRIKIMVLLFTGLAMLAGIIYGTLFARNISRLLGGEPAEARAVLRTIADGDLSQDIQVVATDKTSLFSATQTMQTNLRHLIAQIQLSAESIYNGAQEISAGNTNLSQRTEEQASSLEETASSMEQMASTVKQNAENASQANVMANEASEVAIRGKKAVGQVMFNMHEINTSAKKIVDIISVIDGIAFQTNILALNAAVEAARAGEQGRGFAVVAAEVRNLAQRSATAAKEIKQLINTSVDNVTSGTKLVEDAGETMEDIVMAVKMVTDIVNEIAAASLEQSAGIDQVNNAITNMDEVTQQNAALVEQAAAAAVSLQHLAGELTEATSQFKLGTDADYRDANYQESNKSTLLNQMPPENVANLTASKNNGKRLKAPKTKPSEDWEEF